MGAKLKSKVDHKHRMIHRKNFSCTKTKKSAARKPNPQALYNTVPPI